MTEAIVISKQGINAGTATDPNSFIFHSSYNTFKILVSGVDSYGTVSSPAGTIGTVNHNMGTARPFYAFMKVHGIAEGYMPLNQFYVSAVSVGTDSVVHINGWRLTAYNTANQLIYTITSTQNADAVDVSYFIFAQP